MTFLKQKGFMSKVKSKFNNFTSSNKQEEIVEATVSITGFKVSVKASGLLSVLTRHLIIGSVVTLIAVLIGFVSKLL